MEKPVTLYRKRYEPEETICLKDDELLFHDDRLIVTRWNSLKPRADIARGISAYFLEDHIKVSKVLDADDNLVYWYCDIIQTDYDSETNAYTFTDLLIDVLVYADGSCHVVDLDELGDVLENEAITKEQAILALRAANKLLCRIYENDFERFQNIVEAYEKA